MFKSKTIEYVKSYNKQYYEKNKEKQLARGSEKLYCNVCNSWHVRAKKAIHNRSNKHMKNIINIGTINGFMKYEI